MQYTYTVCKGNGGITDHLSLRDSSNDKLAHGYKLQTVHKQQLVHHYNYKPSIIDVALLKSYNFTLAYCR